MEAVDRRFLTDAQRHELRIWEEFFNHPGWTLYQQRFEPMRGAIIKMFRNAATEGALGYVRGRADLLDAVCDLERIIEAEYANSANEQNPTAESDESDE